MPGDRPARDLALGPFGTEQAGTEIAWPIKQLIQQLRRTQT